VIKAYSQLTKPGIILGNLITAVAGFMLATKGASIQFGLLCATLTGLGLVIASACVFNNYLDRHRDQKMERTRNRPLVQGVIALPHALIYAAGLGILGLLILALFTPALATWVALAGFFGYVVVYGYWKYRTTHGTAIGSIAGAVPPVVGYCAVTASFDWGAALLFALLVLWQMPHFFAIAIYRLEDYVAADIPVLPAKKGIPATKIQMLLYIIGFVAVSLMLTLMGYTGYVTLAVAALLGLTWLALCITGFKSGNDRLWAKGMFRFSLIVITGLCLVISLTGLFSR